MAKTDLEKQAYLDALAECGVRRTAARKAGMTVATVLRLKKEDPVFDTAEEAAFDEAADVLEEAAWKRAVDGVEETRFDKDGNVTGLKTVYSDTLLVRLMEASRPDKFAKRTKNELTGADGEKLFDEATAAARISSILEAARQRRDDTDEVDLIDG